MADRPIVVLMGGQSRRMGRDKAFVQFEGKTFLEHQLEQLQKYSQRVYLSVNQEQYNKLKDQYACIKDIYPNKGPLGGIYSSLKYLEETCIFIPIDMPYAYELMGKLLATDENGIFQMHKEIQFFPIQISISEINKIFIKLIQDNLKLKSYINDINAEVISVDNATVFKNINRLV